MKTAYPVPPHHQNVLKTRLKGAFPISERIHETTLSLPVRTTISPWQIEPVVEVMNAF
ncbi:hypothetical protein [Pedobacter heparinus]|uniref:hypothetical protein n=1 Tax=Pedobacter heparinus TaxID=984 RepID=UPI002931CD44|nr:hypothetical protein [Pedobacter heparinus]